jgi:hypothetical protein
MHKIDFTPPSLNDEFAGKTKFRLYNPNIIKLLLDFGPFFEKIFGTLNKGIFIICHFFPGRFVGQYRRIKVLIAHNVSPMMVRVKNINDLISQA